MNESDADELIKDLNGIADKWIDRFPLISATMFALIGALYAEGMTGQFTKLMGLIKLFAEESVNEAETLWDGTIH